jgi:hypothetical protein
MQFGKIQGIALAVLGIILLGLQAMYYFTATPGTINGPTEVPQTAHHVLSPLFGIFGLISLVVGVGILLTASRRDEPSRRNAVK